MARFFSGPMVATVPADYASAHSIEASAKRLRGGKEVEVVDVEAEQTWVEVPLNPPCAGWVVAARIGLQKNGVPAISELRIFPREEEATPRPPGLWSAEVLGYSAPFPPGGLSGTILRKIGLKWLLGYATSRLRGWEKQVKDYYGRLLDYGTASGLVFELQPSQGGKRGRPRLYDDATLLRAALRHVKGGQVKGDRMGTVRSVRRFVADGLEVSLEQARDIVKTARKRGFLVRTAAPGKVGDILTPQAEALVKSLHRAKRQGSRSRGKPVSRRPAG